MRRVIRTLETDGLKSVWRAHRGRKIGGNAHVIAYNAAIPDDGAILPMLQITMPSDSDFYCEPDVLIACQTSIWAMTPLGRAVGERIVHDLATYGLAWVWPHETSYIRLAIGTHHKIFIIGGTRAN